jgi:hypothetical protein
MRSDCNSIRRPVFRYSRFEAPTDDHLTRIVSCLAIAVFFTGLVWFYGLMYHPNDVWIPSVGTISRGSQHASRSNNSPLLAPVAPAPDMHSTAIQYANSDVAHQPNGERQSGHQATVAQGTAEQSAALKAKHPRIVKQLSPAAANSYAAARYYSRPEIGAE